MSGCHICEKGELKSFLSYGRMPPGNGFLQPNAEDPKFPMDLAVCRACHTVQLEEPIPSEKLAAIYSNYAYVPTGKTLEAHYAKLGAELAKSLPSEARALDVGSNSGILLRAMLDARSDIHIQGIEPAERIGKEAKERGVPTLTGFFNSATSLVLAHDGPYDIITFTQVLQHIPDVRVALFAASQLLSEEGVLFIEGRYILDTLKEGAFDTFYQELLYEFGLISLSNALSSVGLHIFDAERVEAYGGSLRIWASKTQRAMTTGMNNLMGEEYQFGLAEEKVYERFGEQAVVKAKAVKDMIHALVGSTVAYGCPSTGTTLLNYVGVGADEVLYAVDDNSGKHGLLIPGIGIPIGSPELLKEHSPHNILILPWRLAGDIQEKLKWFKGNIVIPLPEPRIVKGG